MEISQRLWHINNQDMLKHDHKSAICSIWLFLCVHLIFFHLLQDISEEKMYSSPEELTLCPFTV